MQCLEPSRLIGENWVHPPIWIYNFPFASSLHARLRNISLSTLYGAVVTGFGFAFGSDLFKTFAAFCPDKDNNIGKRKVAVFPQAVLRLVNYLPPVHTLNRNQLLADTASERSPPFRRWNPIPARLQERCLGHRLCTW